MEVSLGRFLQIHKQSDVYPRLNIFIKPNGGKMKITEVLLLCTTSTKRGAVLQKTGDGGIDQ